MKRPMDFYRLLNLLEDAFSGIVYTSTLPHGVGVGRVVGCFGDNILFDHPKTKTYEEGSSNK